MIAAGCSRRAPLFWTGQRTYLEPDLFYVSAATEALSDPERRTTADQVGQTVELRVLENDRYATKEVCSPDDRLNSLILPGLTIEVRKVFED
jgi:hypothetical protein